MIVSTTLPEKHVLRRQVSLKMLTGLECSRTLVEVTCALHPGCCCQRFHRSGTFAL